MGPNERRPGGGALALWGRWQTVALQDIANRLIADLIPQIGQCPYNPVIAPISVPDGRAALILNRIGKGSCETHGKRSRI
jgi:hypothetical protein